MRLAIFAAVTALVAAQQNIVDPVKDFCRRHKHQTCVIDSKLYIDGGMVYYGGGVNNGDIPQSNTWLLWEDLTAINSTKTFPAQNANLRNKDTEVPIVSGGVLWPDQVNKLFYLFGGEYNDGVKAFTYLWYYDIIYNTWNYSIPDGSQAQVRWPVLGASTVDDTGVAYYYGGYLTNKSESRWGGDALMLNGLVSYDMATKRWSNLTSDVTPRAEGTLQYLPASDRGTLVYFGGRERFSNGTFGYADMSKIRVHDIASGNWFTQTATGDIPQARRGHCANVIWAEDRSSYNIYLWGGIGRSETALGDVHVLSIPSFKWVSLYPDPQMVTFPGGKAYSSCDVILQSQMIVMGGYYTNVSKPDCDARADGGQHGMMLGEDSVDVGNLWHGLMPNVTTYRVPKYIVEVVGGGTDGKATMTQPASGWVTSDLGINFGKSFSAASRTATRLIPATTTPTTGSPSPDQPNRNSHVAAIAGGAVGGILLIGVIVLAICCLRRRRKRRDSQSQTLAQSTPTTDLQTPNTAEKFVSSAHMSQGSTLYSPNLQTPAYSPQGSPIPLSDPHNPGAYHHGSPQQQQYASSDWTQQGGYTYPTSQIPMHHANQQTYYPPPPDSSQSPRQHDVHTMGAELSGVRSPANELPEMGSPVPVNRM